MLVMASTRGMELRCHAPPWSSVRRISGAAASVKSGQCPHPRQREATTTSMKLSTAVQLQPAQTPAVSEAHWAQSWPVEELRQRSREHVMATWIPGKALQAVPILVRGEGCHVYDTEGNRYLDWTSQAVCTNLGYDVPPSVVDAVSRQLKELPMVYGALGNTEIRIRLASLLAELMPEPGFGFLFPCGGSEANEVAVRIARRFTGRSKVISHYRSYHGGSAHSLAATGDFRRGFIEGGGGGAAPVGFVKTMNPTDSHLFAFGASDEERTSRSLGYLEEQILCEGHSTIAAIMFESVIGSGGVYLAPKGYMEGVRALCDKYGILLICDEVMVGFGRTGRFWGFQHYGIVPDIVTSAKGLTGAYAPLSVVATRSHVKEHFEAQTVGWGATFQAHPVSLAAGYECVKFMLEQDLVSRARNLIQPIIREHLDALVAKYSSLARGRCVGAFGCLDLVDPRSGAPVQESTSAYENFPLG